MADILHKIRMYLYDNILKENNSNDFIARIAGEWPLLLRAICADTFPDLETA